eukprot:symbB.v1.2.037392.t1/scaffold5509.1/size26337/2
MGATGSAIMCICQRRCGQQTGEVEFEEDLVGQMVSNKDGNGLDGLYRPVAPNEAFPLPVAAAKPWGAPCSQEDLRRIQLEQQKEHEEKTRLHIMRLKAHEEQQQFFPRQFLVPRNSLRLQSKPTLLQSLRGTRPEATHDNRSAKPPEVSKPPATATVPETTVVEGGFKPRNAAQELACAEVPIVMFDDNW